MSGEKKIVAVISPWQRLPELIKKNFRVESLPAEKKVMVWRDDLQTEEQLTHELQGTGVTDLEIRAKSTTRWQDVD